ncbi:MAG: phthiocerol/phthiodiolone dimycocerosyl transferase family protein [Bradymonadia bacterium]
MRPLNQLESVFRACDRAYPFNFCVFARVEGLLSLTSLSAALKSQQKRFTRLNDSILDVDDQVSQWVEATREPRVEAMGGDSVRDHINQCLDQRFATPDEPLVRLRWLKGEQQHLLLTLNHVVADGVSGIDFFQGVVAAAARIQQGLPIESFASGTGPNADTDPSSSLSSHTPLGGYQFGQDTIFNRRTVVMPVSFDSETTARLIGVVRRYGVSITGLIAACHAMAVIDVIGEPSPISLSFPINLRGRTDEVDAEHFGLAVGNVKLLYRMGLADDIWALARRISGDLKRKAIASSARSTRFNPQAVLAERSTAAVSNVGQVEWTSPPPGIDVHDLGFATGCSFFGDHILTVTTSRGCLQLTYCVCPAAIGAERANPIITQTIDALKAIAVSY